MDTDGFVKILADVATDEVLGVHMVGARGRSHCRGGDRNGIPSVGRRFRECRIRIRPYAEAVKEAALAATDNRPCTYNTE